MEIIHKHLETVSSTNDVAKQALPQLHEEQLLIISTEEQLAGRGQYGRQWVSPKGENLYATFAFTTSKNLIEPLLLTRLLSLATQDCLKTIGVECEIKSPNDLLVSHKKIAGILCETVDLFPKQGIAIGIGLNVNMEKEALEQVGQPATSLFIETGQKHKISDIFETIQKHFIISLLKNQNLQ